MQHLFRSFGAKHCTPRSLSSKFLGNVVCVEGIVTKCSLVRPKVVRSVHYCPATKKTIERRYTDLTSYDPFPSSAVYPTAVSIFIRISLFFLSCRIGVVTELFGRSSVKGII